MSAIRRAPSGRRRPRHQYSAELAADFPNAPRGIITKARGPVFRYHEGTGTFTSTGLVDRVPRTSTNRPRGPSFSASFCLCPTSTDRKHTKNSCRRIGCYCSEILMSRYGLFARDVPSLKAEARFSWLTVTTTLPSGATYRPSGQTNRASFAQSRVPD